MFLATGRRWPNFLNPSKVEGKNLHVFFDTILVMIPGPSYGPGEYFQKN
jgi:hypothetical protein